MDSRKMIKSAAMGLLAAGILSTATTALAADKEKCFGIALAGKNDCASKFSNHSCAGQSRVDKDPNDFKLVPTGTCTQMHGSLKAAADKS